ncbi:MAG: DinB family protein [Acidobacteriota bacterium]|nr:DinB family protein [Acidobacteriota bacterium]
MKQFLESPSLLETIVVEAEKNSEIARQLAAGLTEEQLNWTSDPAKWSMAQCLDHLTTTSQQFGPYLTAAIARGRQKWPVKEPVPYRPTWVGGWLVRQVNPETGRNLPAPKVFRPSQSKINGALESFLKQQSVFLEFVRQAKGLDYNKVRLRSPVTPLMRYSLADAFVVTALHGQRHLGQARRMRETAGFHA